jgi:hypothetical protein
MFIRHIIQWSIFQETKKKQAIMPQKDMEELLMLIACESNQSQMATYCMIPTMHHSETLKDQW